MYIERKSTQDRQYAFPKIYNTNKKKRQENLNIEKWKQAF